MIRYHLVLFDGWTAADDFIELTRKSIRWSLRSNRTRQRLTFVCAVASRGKIQEDVEAITRAKEFHVWSWTLDECLDAIKDREVYKSASPYLDAPEYYYAGGSCRYMFHIPTKTVPEKLKSPLIRCTILRQSEQRSALSVNSLFAMWKYMSIHRDSSNPALDGWMLEMLFLGSLRNGGLALVDAVGNNLEWWKQSLVVVSDGIPALSPAQPVWIKPLVRLVQVTSAHKHSFRIKYFYRWLKMMSESPHSFNVETIDIVFVAEQDQLSAFEFKKVTGEELVKGV
ncbi:hypothetical protein GQ600_14498 [Phytophthora cactorum]|nr:hypothetical protein GQ600_14498 [Phytophthora cactorum]